MSSLIDDILKFLSDDLFRVLAKLFSLVPDLIGMDASTLCMVVLGVAGAWGVYWVVQQFLD